MESQPILFELLYGKEEKTVEVARHATFEEAKKTIGTAFGCPDGNMMFQYIDLGNHITYIETAPEWGSFVLGPCKHMRTGLPVQMKIKHRVLVENSRLRIVDLPRHLEVLEKRALKATEMAEAELRAAKAGVPPVLPPKKTKKEQPRGILKPRNGLNMMHPRGILKHRTPRLA